MSSLPQLRLRDGYREALRGNVDATTRDPESGNAISDQLNTRGAYRVTNQQSLACLSGSERRRPGWFLDMNLSLVKIFTAQGQRGGRFLE